MLKAVAIWLSTEKLPISDLGDGVWAEEEARLGFGGWKEACLNLGEADPRRLLAALCGNSDFSWKDGGGADRNCP